MQVNTNLSNAKYGYYISIITAIITVITFGIAIGTPPLSGPFCKGDCFQYPFVDIASRFPRDYLWMYPAISLSFLYLIMIICVHQFVSIEKKLFSLSSVAFAIMATLVLSVDYFIQLSFIQPSLLAGETEGIALFSQFNPHGIFIILEEIGFIFMIISFSCLIPVFSGSAFIEKAIKWTFIIALILAVLSFTLITLLHGIQREYRFEVIIISITWIELIITGILLARYFHFKILGYEMPMLDKHQQ